MSSTATSKRTHPRPRTAGILLHISSLPGPFGVGDLGPAAHAFAQSLARAKQTWWQILPLNPTLGHGNPYNSFSAFAANPILISPDALVADGLLHRTDVSAPAFRESKVDYRRAGEFKSNLLNVAWERFTSTPHPLRPDFDRFRHHHASWLDDFALFAALKELYPNRPWIEWDHPLAFRHADALAAARRTLADRIERHQFVQFLFFRQLDALRRHAKQLGVKLFGDLPIFVSCNSADVWANPHLFLLDKHRRPRVVGGCPPDYFCETGQRWGNPLYNWRAMRQDNFAWWTSRLRATLAHADLVRIDHFRAFEAAWHIPAHHPTAKNGRWIKAPGHQLFRAFQKSFGHLPLVAEDLGLITPQVVALREAFQLPGMKVLQFAFGGSPDDPFLPHTYERNTVAYTGTHDNDTTLGWYRALNADQRRRVQCYLGTSKDMPWTMIRLAWSSVADTAIAPLQDVLGLGTFARMNLPGTSRGNWSWRFRQTALTNWLWYRLGELTETYGRAATQVLPDAASQKSP